MFKYFLLLCLITYVRCESEIDSVTTVQPNYSANQVDEENGSVDQIEAKKPEVIQAVPIVEKPIAEKPIDPVLAVDEIPSIEPELQKVREVNQVHIDLNSAVNMEANMLTNLADEPTTTVTPTVIRVKRTPRYTVGEVLAPNGIMHEIGHLRDHAVNGLAKRVGATRMAQISKERTEIHHKYHHMPNHLAYMPVVGPLLSRSPRVEPRDGLRLAPTNPNAPPYPAYPRGVGPLTSVLRTSRAQRSPILGGLFRRMRSRRRPSLFRRLRRLS